MCTLPEHRLEAVADFIYAALGMISRNIRTIALEFRGTQHFIAHFSIWEEDDVTLEDLQQIVEDFEATQPVGVRVERSVKVFVPGETEEVKEDIFPIYMSKEAKSAD